MSEHEEILESMNKKMGFTPPILDTLGDLDPEFLLKYRRCDNKMLSDGALSGKVKRLMALAVVSARQCNECTVSQMKSALNAGATKEEIMETMDVIFLTAGAPSVAVCRDALKMLK